jgi:hypothetical protein
MTTAIIVVLIVAAAYWAYVQSQGKSGKSAPIEPPSEHPATESEATGDEAVSDDHPYRAESILSYGSGCPAVEAFSQRRFLVGESPALPLPDCTSEQCNCKYIQHEDRRYDGRGRRLVFMEAEIDEVADLLERRVKEVTRGRRKSDKPADSV